LMFLILCQRAFKFPAVLSFVAPFQSRDMEGYSKNPGHVAPYKPKPELNWVKS
jgi:hypothetical protein